MEVAKPLPISISRRPPDSGQGPDAPDRISATLPPIRNRYVTEPPRPQDAGEKARKCQLGGGGVRRIRGEL